MDERPGLMRPGPSGTSRNRECRGLSATSQTACRTDVRAHLRGGFFAARRHFMQSVANKCLTDPPQAKRRRQEAGGPIVALDSFVARSLLPNSDLEIDIAHSSPDEKGLFSPTTEETFSAPFEADLCPGRLFLCADRAG